MSRIVPKKLMQWREPKAICQWRYEQSKMKPMKKLWVSVISTVLIWGFMMLLWLMAYLTPSKEPAPLQGTLLGALAFSVFCVLLVWIGYWVTLRSPYKVTVYANKICLTNAGGERCIKTRNITECVMSSVTTNERTLPLLTINSNKTNFSIGVPPDMVSKVVNVLASIRVTVKGRQ